jgi:hypothetical protein
MLGRPEGISDGQAKIMMYVTHHNLNTDIAIGGTNNSVPNTAKINQTNAVSEQGSLGLIATQCAGMFPSISFAVVEVLDAECCFILTFATGKWARPPNFLLVDFYDQGPPSGSVSDVASRVNGVTYNRPCCGTTARS